MYTSAYGIGAVYIVMQDTNINDSEKPVSRTLTDVEKDGKSSCLHAWDEVISFVPIRSSFHTADKPLKT